jgi:hypothetical protein
VLIEDWQARQISTATARSFVLAVIRWAIPPPRASCCSIRDTDTA